MRDLIWKFGLVAALVALVALPFSTNPYAQYVVNLALVNVVIAIGLNVLLGYAGQFAFAHTALMGIGAYATALLGYWFGLSFWIALPLSGLLAMAIGSLGAFPAMRMKSVYLALITMAFAEFVGWGLIHWKDVTLGTDGVPVESPSLFGHMLVGDTDTYYALLVITIALFVVARLITHSRIGRAMTAVRENEIVAQCAGIDVARTKLYAFAFSAFYAGIGGSMFALTLGFIVPESFGVPVLIVQFSMVVIGGLASLYGSIIGAIVLTALPEVLRDFQALQEIVYGVMLVIFIVLMPKGIAGLVKRTGLLPEEILVRGAALKMLRLPTASPASQAKAGFDPKATFDSVQRETP